VWHPAAVWDAPVGDNIFQGQVGREFEQCGVAEGVPAYGMGF